MNRMMFCFFHKRIASQKLHNIADILRYRFLILFHVVHYKSRQKKNVLIFLTIFAQTQEIWPAKHQQLFYKNPTTTLNLLATQYVFLWSFSWANKIKNKYFSIFWSYLHGNEKNDKKNITQHLTKFAQHYWTILLHNAYFCHLFPA
jgi:hypothetical protein